MAENATPKDAGKGRKRPKAESAAAATPEGQIARILVRALWKQEQQEREPDMTPAQLAKAWQEVRQARLDAELKKTRRALQALKRAGVVMTLTEKAAKGEETAPEA